MRYFKLLTEDGYIGDYTKGFIYSEDYITYAGAVSVGKVVSVYSNDWQEVSEEEYLKQEGLQPNESTNIKPYYKGKSSLYLFAEEYGLNSWEFDIIKRVIRCRHKGSWLEDLEKTKGVIDIYIKECKEEYNDMLPR